MRNNTLFGLGVIAVMALGTLVGCGGAIDSGPVEEPTQLGQELWACTSDYKCPTGNTCVKGTCRPKCGDPLPIEEVDAVSQMSDTLSYGTCASGSRCCPGYYYSETRITEPYCMPNTQSCATFP